MSRQNTTGGPQMDSFIAALVAIALAVIGKVLATYITRLIDRMYGTAKKKKQKKQP